MIIKISKKIITLGAIILSCHITYAQGEVEYNDDYNGGQIEFIPGATDFYDKEFFINLETITIDINEFLGINELVLGSKYEILFNIDNPTSKDLEIRGFSNPCLCIQPDWHKTPIAPGESGFVKVKYTATIVGPSQKQFKAYLYDKNTNKPVAKVTVILSAVGAQPLPSNQN